jgi:hypothetical protein
MALDPGECHCNWYKLYNRFCLCYEVVIWKKKLSDTLVLAGNLLNGLVTITIQGNTAISDILLFAKTVGDMQACN